MSRRNKYIGKFAETKFEPIDLPFSVESFKFLLSSATSSSSYSHQQIADWANRFWWDCMEGDLSEQQNAGIGKAANVARDVDAQWAMFLDNTYSLEQLQNMDFSKVKLPVEWFKKWWEELA